MLPTLACRETAGGLPRRRGAGGGPSEVPNLLVAESIARQAAGFTSYGGLEPGRETRCSGSAEPRWGQRK